MDRGQNSCQMMERVHEREVETKSRGSGTV